MAATDIVQLGAAMIIIGFGYLGNAFIILVFLLEYRRSHTLQPHELIVSFMSICNVGTELGFVVFFVLYLLNFCTYVGETFYEVVHFFTIFLPKTVIWLTACLCFVYCMKIIKVNWRIFMRLKQKISLAVNCMIVGTLLLCTLVSFPIALFIKFKINSTNICRDYYTDDEDKEFFFIYASSLSLLTSLLPLILMLVSSLGIVIFLCLHSRKMDKNITTNSTSRNDAHTSVAIMLLCLITLFIACAGTALSVNLQIATGQFDIQIAIALSTVIYSAGSPMILIIGTVKLRNNFTKLLCPNQRK
ncbi:taste receptor type 2 member 1-like [Latimeria chalumnae]|uniref:taste receptor type 2 member 1-like n=1 Tax=Latimeria chalumnae TaxID=7897 RepID=UPI0003C11DEC|nr:PREDICTED: taste receptor type 2 member 1-like [Latimeria chalumnae]|eukprot:XP_006012362.1 PREDICTED: taste receptor type 2 member 1-like [Latimeria chalumnae]